MFRDFYFTLNFVREYITQNNLLDLYQQLISAFQQLQSNQNEETEKNFQESKGKLVETLSLINYSSWPPHKISILKHVGATELLGTEAISRLENIFQKNIGNPNMTVQSLEQFRSETNNLLSKTQQLIDLLNLSSEEKAPENGRKVVEVAFQDEASLDNFWEIEDRAKDFRYIIRTVTRLTGVDFKTVKIVSISTASDPITMALDLVQKSAGAFIAVAKAAAEVKKLKDLFLGKKIKAKELGLRSETVEIVLKDLEEQKGAEHKKKIGELSVSITKEYMEKKKGINDQHEIENMVGIALEKMSNLVNDGVRVLDPAEVKPVGEPDQAVLGTMYSEIKKIEQEIKPLLLEEGKERKQQREKKMKKDLKVNKNSAKKHRHSTEKETVKAKP
ncbi:MAG: hypothetical protein UT84_C0022G0007 [Candidatus Curtissbacteria bacterium GW2011_GWA1_40_16]|uniref:Uncharacterized protein n=1 Tax=Candidatus Curtissbacteria bacterium GW2011_GWA1_40_16 TaxID=1618405 RepID=A0A0G0RAA6_9BACT|nr:MAG: hypothetical protein UT84_C0022G0007 [Candidatus Curtissbacteria bacterium GW2011_GWA1_40_16]